jgi:hypothetical protein
MQACLFEKDWRGPILRFVTYSSSLFDLYAAIISHPRALGMRENCNQRQEFCGDILTIWQEGTSAG